MMQRLRWIVVPAGAVLGAVAVTLQPRLVALAGLGLATAALLVWLPPVLTLALPILVTQVLGAGLVVPGWPMGAAQVCYPLVLFAVLYRRSDVLPRLTGPIDRAMAALVLVSLVATLGGALAGYEATDIKDDIASVIFFALTYLAARTLVRSRREFDILVAVILVGSFLAAIKLAYLVVIPVHVDWTGPWQALKLHAFGLPRIVLRGGDVFFVVTALIVFARVLGADRVSLPAAVVGLLSLSAVVLAGTRSNWIGFAVGILVCVAVGGNHGSVRGRRFAMAVAVFALVGLLSIVFLPPAQRFASRFVDAARARQYTVTFRLLESEGVLSEVRAAYGLGAGMGSTYTYWNLDRAAIVRTSWTHNAYLMLLMKTGVLGLAVFLALVVRTGRTASRLIRAGHPWATGLVGMLSGMTAVLVLSISVNKVFEFSGALFLGLALGAIQSAEDAEVDRATR